MPPKRTRPVPLLVALAVTPAHYNSGAPHTAEEVIAAKVIGASRHEQSDTFFAHTTSDDGSASSVLRDFVKWLVHHTDKPVCVVVGLDKFASTALGRMICLSGLHLRVLDLASMAAGQGVDLVMAVEITTNVSHGVVEDASGHIPPRDEVDFIVGQLKDRFTQLLPVTMRRKIHQNRKRMARVG